MSHLNQMLSTARRRAHARDATLESLLTSSGMRWWTVRDASARLLWRVHRDTKPGSKIRAHEKRQAYADARIIAD